ncbi:MAG: SelB C-terminal domain-containing protein [Sedimentitalea sp.]
MKTCPMVVIGHVDHGKTSLVRALTGQETDRLPEEKARGLSIIPGFAHRSYPNGIIDFIDAPGHEDFIQAMVCATSGAQAALLVVSAPDGIAAQTLEHLCIAGLLGLEIGVIAVTKSDLVPAARLPVCLQDIRAAVSRTPLAQAQMITCSVITGTGLKDLHAALDHVLHQDMRRPGPLASFLAIDRAFSRAGLGTVVTGTLLGQDLPATTALTLQPQGRSVTLRSLQSRGQTRDTIQTGERMAANLRGVAVDEIARGSVLCASGVAEASTCFDVSLDMIAGAKHLDDVRVMFGTTSEVAQLRLFASGRIEAHQSGFGQVRFKKAVCGFAGQRAVLRRLSPPETIGGAVLLDPQARPARAGDRLRLRVLQATQGGVPAEIANALIAANSGVADPRDVARLARLPINAVGPALADQFVPIGANLISSHSEIARVQSSLLHALGEYHAAHPLWPKVPVAAITRRGTSPDLQTLALTALHDSNQIRPIGTGWALCSHDPIAALSPAQRTRYDQLEATFEHAGLTPPVDIAQTGFDQTVLTLLESRGHLVSLRNVALKQTVILHIKTLIKAGETLARAFPPPHSFTTGQARDQLGTSRKIIVPVLEYFDSLGVTIRTGDTRQIGARKLVSSA